MDNTKFYEEAIALAKQAVEADTAKRWPEALDLYQRAVDRFVSGLKFEKDPTRSNMIQAQAIRYLERAETIKKGLDDKEAHGGAGGAATASKGHGDESADAEAGKLKGALAGAIVSEKPNVKWDDVAGLEGAKEALKEAVILPYRFPQLFTGKRKPWKGILLYGPPGTGKSYLAKAVATEANATFFAISSSDLVSKWQGESERLVKNLFEMAREKKPSIVFIDEIDSLCGARGEGSESESSRRIKTEFLVQMQGVSHGSEGLLVLAATNTPWEIDPAMRRRFEKRIYIPLPESPARRDMFHIHLGDTPNSLREGDFGKLGEHTEGYSGSDIAVLVREALMEPLRKCRLAKWFQPIVAEDGRRMLTPFLDPDGAPPCVHCPKELHGVRLPARTECRNCGALRMTLYELETHELYVPKISAEDFITVLTRSKPTVAERELERFEKFTAEFGSDGS